ncbi:MAG: glycosyl hydrolase [Anaerolineae bacterium]|nr:glycosyl hydrolase [Anaerolineae bacterium]NUQ04898.1 glycosyl hydrolase [Anaerolineae bacterium]
MKKKQSPSDGIVITRRHLVIGAICLIGAVIGVFVLLNARQQDGTSGAVRVEIPHIHGLGFSSDGSRLLVPAHIGLLVYENNQWSQPDLPAHDYMGFSPIDSGFFSSGHPDLRTDYEPLLGLIKSEDGGRTITTLIFEGESDFHLLAAGYRNHAVYVINQSPNSQLGVGMFYTLDEGQTWQQSQAAGLESSPIQIAVHPDELGTVAVATEDGLWLSTDYGNTFTPVFTSEPVTAVVFDLDANRLYFGYRQLYRLDLATGENTPLLTPPLANNDALIYVADSPTSGQMAAATNEKDIFVLFGDGAWTQIANDGIGGE